ncbi:MAG: DUF1476 domain-containing protein [Alphaproteobacteria bacterium]|nr:DUF1476 domain-containing protein [Alphaproteobacteria bacterium]
MSNMEDRQRAFENKFAHDAEKEFKVNARRNKLLGLWAAQKLGKTGEEADAYAKDVVIADLESAGDNDVIGKLLKDFGRAGVAVHISEIEKQMADLLPIARKQLAEG